MYFFIFSLIASPVILFASIWKLWKHDFTNPGTTISVWYLNAAFSAAAVFALFEGFYWALIGLLFPPLVLVIVLAYLSAVFQFLALFIWFPLIFGVLVFMVAFAFRKTRPLAWSLAFALFLAVSIPAGEATSREQMCRSAQELGVTEFKRSTLFWSIRNHDLFSGPAHASFTKDDQFYNWSYHLMAFVNVTGGRGAESRGELTRC